MNFADMGATLSVSVLEISDAKHHNCKVSYIRNSQMTLKNTSTSQVQIRISPKDKELICCCFESLTQLLESFYQNVENEVFTGSSTMMFGGFIGWLFDRLTALKHSLPAISGRVFRGQAASIKWFLKIP